MLNYEIVPGQRLVFVDLAKQLNVSRTPVNNALGMLAQEGYLDFVPNQGYSVHKMTRKEAEDLYEVREVLEIGFIGSAIRKMTDAKLSKIKQKKLDYENALDKQVTRKFFILDTEFHLSILEMAGNEYLDQRYKSICQKIFLRHRTENLVLGRIKEIIEEHNRLFEAIQMRDVEMAKEYIKSHYKASKNALFPIIFAKEA
jgi:DNA-binding GntR family transcriptional regulator